MWSVGFEKERLRPNPFSYLIFWQYTAYLIINIAKLFGYPGYLPLFWLDAPA